MNFKDRIYVAGHNGLVGSAIVRHLKNAGCENVITRTSGELDLRNQQAVIDFFKEEKPEYVFLAAAKVGGIMANKTYPADFIYDNISIQNNIIHESYKSGVKKLLFLGSSCIYPKDAPQPIKEEYLLTGSLESTNEAYAVAKIAGIKLCQYYKQQYGCNFISAMPTNLYGVGDNYDLHNSHVLPALIRKFHEAKINNEPSVTVWGSGKPKREFLHVGDAASACYFLMQNYDGSEIVNIGSGKDISIIDLAIIVKEVVGYLGSIDFNRKYPDGTLRKLLDVQKINLLGWYPSINLREGIETTYKDFVNKYDYYTA